MTKEKPLPEPGLYEKEIRFMPWGETLRKVAEYIEKQANQGASVLDVMCGPGTLLGRLQATRPDLDLVGTDVNGEYIDYAKNKYGGVDFFGQDVFEFLDQARDYDIVTCTAGIHYVPYGEQNRLARMIGASLEGRGFAIVADPMIKDYDSELDRKLASAELGDAYLREVIRRGAPDEIIQVAMDITYNDVFGHEYKTSPEKLHAMLRGNFADVHISKIWPITDARLDGFGDYMFVLSKPRQVIQGDKNGK